MNLPIKSAAVNEIDPAFWKSLNKDDSGSLEKAPRWDMKFAKDLTVPNESHSNFQGELPKQTTMLTQSHIAAS